MKVSTVLACDAIPTSAKIESESEEVNCVPSRERYAAKLKTVGRVEFDAAGFPRCGGDNEQWVRNRDSSEVTGSGAVNTGRLLGCTLITRSGIRANDATRIV